MPMNFNDRLGGFPVLTTSRLRLREIRPDDDATAHFAIWTDPRVLRYLPHLPSESVDDSLKALHWLRDRFYDAHILAWGIALIDDDTLIGGMRYHTFSGHNYLIGEVGYELAWSHWGSGLMAEALMAATDLGFDRIGLNRVQLTTHPDNCGSRRTAEKSGFVKEGLLHRWEFSKQTGLWEDRLMYARTRPDGAHATAWLI